MSLIDVLGYVILAIICMAVCTAIESARVTNDMLSALHGTLQTLEAEAKDAPISDAEYEAATKELLSERPSDWLRWRSRFLCVRMTIGISYIVTETDVLRVYRDWRRRVQEIKGARRYRHRRNNAE